MKIELSPEHFNTIMKSCKPFITRDNEYPMLAYIELSCDGATVTATALDGCKLISLKVPCNEGSDCGKIIVPLMKPLGKGVWFARITENEKELKVETVEGAQIYHKVNGQYFDYSKTFPPKDEPKSVCWFNPKLLADALSSFTEKCVAIKYYGDKKAVMISGANQQALVSPLRPPKGLSADISKNTHTMKPVATGKEINGEGLE